MGRAEQSLRSIFLAALEIGNAQERAEFLARACAADPGLRHEVEELLRAETDAGGFLPEKPIQTGLPAALLAGAEVGADIKPLERPAGAKSAEHIGRYKLLEKIGEGGCGVVYMAEQEQPVRRKVALKVIKLGMDTRQVINRFEAERQALALMDHPNIAKVHDAGATETGRPYFVMELVRGVRITHYCDQHQLSTRQRLELFIQVCQAVQHAHQKGVIHRDLKPSNILVTENDGVPIPKVIDFGIAKATEGRLTDQTLFTGFEQFLGTPAYTSPEQAAMMNLDIDTRSDIYSLGALLYELLTGTTPFDTKALLAVGLDELRRTIRETDPARPSTRLSMMIARGRVSTARPRQSETLKLIHLLRGELDWIVMKCLQKDRTRRYETANGLALDIKRHLNSEPVLARPPSRLYEFEKTVRRHKVGFLSAAVILMVASTGALVSTLEAIRANRLRVAAEASQNNERRQVEKARLAEAAAKQELWKSYLAQAQAGRWSQRPGRRYRGLELLKKAAELRPSLELRNEAIACMVLADLRTVQEWKDPPDDIASAFDADYERYAFADSRGVVHLLRLEDGAELMQFAGYAPPFRALEFSPNGRFLFLDCGPDGNRAEILDLDRRVPLLRLNEPHFRSMTFSAGTQYLAIAYGRAKDNWPVYVFDLKTKEKIGSFSHGTLPSLMRFDPQHLDRLLTSDLTPTVRLWDWRKGRLVRSFVHPNMVEGIAWHPQGQLIATGCADRKVHLRDAATGQELAALAGHGSWPFEVYFSRDGEFLASRGWDGVLRLWDPQAQRDLLSIAIAGFSFPFGATNNRLAITSGLNTCAILEAAGGYGLRLLREELSPDDYHEYGDFSSDGRFFLTTSLRGLTLWDVKRGRQLGRITKATSNRSACFHPDSRRLFLTVGSGVEEWELHEAADSDQAVLQLARRFEVPFQNGRPLVDRSGRLLATGAEDALHWFDLETGKEKGRLIPPSSEVLAALSPDARFAATWNRAGTNVQVWDLARSNVIHTLSTLPSTFAVFSPDNHWLAIGNRHEFRTFDTQTWRSHYQIPRQAAGHYGYCAFSADSRILAVAISRSRVVLVRTEDGRELATLEPPQPMDIHWITFSPEGRQLAVVAETGPVQLWDLRLLREQLKPMRLDWDLPPYPPPRPIGAAVPLTIQADGSPFPRQQLQRSIPARDPQTPQSLLDLTPYYNVPLTESWSEGYGGNDLSELPRGIQAFAGVRFDVRGLIQAGGISRYQDAFPTAVTAIKVDQHCRRLQFLHAAAYADSAAEGTRIGTYVVHYANGDHAEIPIVLGQTLADWWGHPHEENKPFTIAWTGRNPLSRRFGKTIRLFTSSWENPHPDVAVRALDLLWAGTEAAPFLVAVTAE